MHGTDAAGVLGLNVPGNLFKLKTFYNPLLHHNHHAAAAVTVTAASVETAKRSTSLNIRAPSTAFADA
jgi:hypothetical protein